MPRTPFCDLLGIEHPIVQAGMGPFGSDASLAAAVSNAGAIGSLGGAFREPDELRSQLRMIRERTDRPFIVNFVQPWLQGHPECLDIALEMGAPVISLALGDPGDLPTKVHGFGSLFIQQVHTVSQARLVADRGVDVVIAQGTEAGGFGGVVAMSVLVPNVVDAVSPLPVLAAGGIADGRGLAAALVLGAQGVNMGTRFLASEEASVSDAWKQAILSAEAQDAVKVDVWDDIFPKPGGGAFDVVPRALNTPFVRHLQGRRGNVTGEAGSLKDEILAGVQGGHMEEFVPFTGQSAGMISEILPVAEIVRRVNSDSEKALQAALRLGSS